MLTLLSVLSGSCLPFLESLLPKIDTRFFSTLEAAKNTSKELKELNQDDANIHFKHIFISLFAGFFFISPFCLLTYDLPKSLT